PQLFEGVDGIVVPGGFGDRGIEGMIETARFCREHDLPYFGLCLGMQIATIEFARHVLGHEDANSTEMDHGTSHPVIDFMPGQYEEIDKGGTMRLGAWPCDITPGTLLDRAYGKAHISERHRHRYEFNNDYREEFTQHGMVFSGLSPDGLLVEAMEDPGCRYFVGVQFHPEFLSRPNKPHPLFKEFITAALGE
ncbi:MAG: gamma-glutamyl-gamma-aminobutyrate hydrolase family protein, partial [Lachnospiraceae bacterium]|nr:gamma-glutamyl-gamma-aminobutyrate hydrolase family protein [Lachnospiraceae bacterium]